MKLLNYLVCRCNIDFSKNPNTNFLSFQYDKKSKVRIDDCKQSLETMQSFYTPSYVIGNKDKLIFKESIKSFILVFIVNLIVSFLTSGITIEGFFQFGIDYTKFLLYQFTFTSTLLAAWYNLIWSLYSSRDCLDYYGKINAQLSTKLRKENCSFDIAQEEVIQILNNSHFFGAQLNFKNLPFKEKYIDELTRQVKKVKPIYQYEYEYSKTLSKITNKGSVFYSIIFFVLSVFVSAFSFIDTWNSIESSDYHINMILVTIFLFAILPLILWLSINYIFAKERIKLEALYCLYSYQYLDMPYDIKNFRSIPIPLLKTSKVDNKSKIKGFVRTFNQVTLFSKISYRDINLGNGILKIYNIGEDQCTNDKIIEIFYKSLEEYK